MSAGSCTANLTAIRYRAGQETGEGAVTGSLADGIVDFRHA